ncbi:MAG: hypothetical protein AB8H86_10625 [Polyangiales bacterium]
MKRVLSLLIFAAFTSPAFAQETGSVELPLEAYQELLGQQSPSSSEPSYAFSNVRLSVRIEESAGGNRALVTVNANVRTFSDGWTLVPLRATGAIESATAGGSAAALVERSGSVAWPAEGAGTHALSWTYPVRAARYDTGWVVALASPGAGAQLDATFVGMEVSPVVVPAADVNVETGGGHTRVRGAIPAGAGVQISWRGDASSGFTLSRARYRGELVGDAMRFTAELSAELDGSRAMVPLFPSNVALESVSVDRAEAAIAVQDGQFAVPIRGRGRHRISASFLVAVQREDGLPRVELDIAATPVSRFELGLPGDRDVQVVPEAGVRSTRRGERTLAAFNVPMTRHVRIEWAEAVPLEAVEVETRAHANIVHVVRPEEGVLGLRAFVNYEISRGSLRRAEIALPRDVQINSVQSRAGDVVSDWRVQGEGRERTLMVFLDRELQGALQLDVHYERGWPVATRTTEAFDVPLLRAKNVHRQRGMIALLAIRELTLEPGVAAHLSRVGDNQLPAAIRDELDATVAHTFRYLDEAPRLAATGATREPEAPRFDAQVDTLVSLGDVSTTIATRVEVDVKSGSLTELALRMPEGLSLLEVSAPSLRRYVLSDDGRTLNIELTQPMEGRFTVELLCDRITGQEEELSIPLLGAAGAEVERGRVGVEALAPFQVDMASAEHLSPIDASELPEPLLLRTDNPILHAFRYAQATEAPRFSVRITRHEEIQTRNATVDEAHYSTLYTRDGVAVTSARFVMHNRRQQFLRVTLPEGAEVWSASVDGHAQTPALESGDGDEATVLLNIVSAAEGFDVQLVYATRVPALGAAGRLYAELPELDIVVTRTLWDLVLPEGVTYASPSSSLALVEEGTYVNYADLDMPGLEGSALAAPASGTRYVFQAMYGSDGVGAASVPYVAGVWGSITSVVTALGALLVWFGLLAIAMVRFGWGLPGSLGARIPLATYRDPEAGVVAEASPLKRWGPLAGAAMVGGVLLLITLGYLNTSGAPALWLSGAIVVGLIGLIVKERLDGSPRPSEPTPAVAGVVAIVAPPATPTDEPKSDEEDLA